MGQHTTDGGLSRAARSQDLLVLSKPCLEVCHAASEKRCALRIIADDIGGLVASQRVLLSELHAGHPQPTRHRQRQTHYSTAGSWRWHSRAP